MCTLYSGKLPGGSGRLPGPLPGLLLLTHLPGLLLPIQHSQQSPAPQTFEEVTNSPMSPVEY